MSVFLDKARQFLPFLPGKPRPTHKEIMALRPLRNPHATWKRTGEDGLVTVTLTRSLAHRFDRTLASIFKIPADRKIEMSDELSSRVWELCDGAHTVLAISTEIGKRYQLGQREAEVSVLTFLNTLQVKKLVGLSPDQQTTKVKKQEPSSGDADAARGSEGFYVRRKQRTR